MVSLQGPDHTTTPKINFEGRTEHQAELELTSRRRTLRWLLTFTQDNQLGSVKFLDLVEMLGLEAELEELVGSSTERHQRLTVVREQLQLQLDELKEQEPQ